MKKFRAWIAQKFTKLRAWVIGVLIAAGLFTGAVMASEKTFTWTNPTQNTDGSVFDPAKDLKETRIYCNIDPDTFIPEKPASIQELNPVLTVPGPAEVATRDFLVGDYTCYATSVSNYGYESDLSNAATFTITPTVAPAAITNFTVQ